VGNNRDRKPFLTATVLDQEFLDHAHDNLLNQLELVVDIERPPRPTESEPVFIRASDRGKYKGSTFYEALLKFPVIRRTIGQFLSPTIEFSAISLELSNVDGRLNDVLPAGDNFAGWIGRDVDVQLGLRDVASSYTSIFKGTITEEGGFSRSIKSISINARDNFDKLNQTFPNTVFKKADFPALEGELENVIIPYIYGDWTVNIEPVLNASVPATPVNGADTTVNGDVSHVTPVLCIISENANASFDTSGVVLKRGDKAWRFDSSDIGSVVSNRQFEITQNGTNMTALTPDTTNDPFEYSSGDEILVRVIGKDVTALGATNSNIVSQGRDVLNTFAGTVAGDFDASWDTFRDKAAPAESAVSAMKSRIWIQEPVAALEFVLSLFEQVRLEAFIDRNLKIKMSSLHLDDFVASPAFSIRNFDVEKDSFTPMLDERNNFNRAQGVYNFLPNRNENLNSTPIIKNTVAVTAADDKEISKKIVFPNLYEESTVKDQLEQILRIASGYIEHIELNATWRSVLLDIGDFVKINVQIQGTVFSNVPAMIREIGYDPQGIKIPMRLWSFQMLPFPGHSPGFAGITGGNLVTITEE